jgi:exodeoxyribonuclease VII small subunit
VTSRKARNAASPEGADTASGTNAGPPDFERALSDLEAIVERLEQGDLPLEESLKQFERGVELTRQCQVALKQAEQKVEILLRKAGQAETFEGVAGETRDTTDAD